MKLMMCLDCKDVKRVQDFPTFCQCQAATAVYVDAKVVEANDKALILGVSDKSLSRAVEAATESHTGNIWTQLFFLPELCSTVRRV